MEDWLRAFPLCDPASPNAPHLSMTLPASKAPDAPFITLGRTKKEDRPKRSSIIKSSDKGDFLTASSELQRNLTKRRASSDGLETGRPRILNVG